MKKRMLLFTIGFAITITAQAADNKKEQRQEPRTERAEKREIKADIEAHASAINRLDNTPAAFQAGLSVIFKETAVPVTTLEQLHKDHPKVGLAGLFLASEISTHSHKPAPQLIKQRASGKTWNEIAVENNENLETLDSKLAKIEQAMKAAVK